MLASSGEMTPPCGVPVSVGFSFPLRTNPAFNHPSISFWEVTNHFQDGFMGDVVEEAFNISF